MNKLPERVMVTREHFAQLQNDAGKYMQAERDAERYRYLREHVITELYLDLQTPEETDAIIDRARNAGK